MTRSRRAVLAGGAAALASLAGCSAFDRDTPEYDREKLAALGETTLPDPPAAFPVSIPASAFERHRTRARTLVERVPERPDIPNGAVAGRLRRERAEVLDELEASPDRDEGGPLDRLGEARNVRADAASVAAAYRAATGDIAAETVAARRDRLRRDRLGFEREWRRRGGDPATALVVHRELEDLSREVRRGIAPERAFPPDPASAVFHVGRIVRELEAGRAALTDAERLRARYLDASAEPRSFATALSVGGARLRRRIRSRESRLHEYVGSEVDRLPFDRSIEGTALEDLYRETAASVQRHREDANRARRRGMLATALLETGIEMTAWRTLGTVVRDVRDGDLVVPSGVPEIRAAQRRAADAVTAAWAETPTVLATALARPAYSHLRQGTGYLGGAPWSDEPVDEGDAGRVFASFVRARHYANAVPETMAAVRDAYLSIR
ncbi:MAG: hypothetical protein ABEI80_09085 [Haloplanus sp.]